MKLLIDMNLSPRWVDVLSAAGFEAAHWSMLGVLNASDQVLMAHAKTFGMVVLTHDLDFGAILAATGWHKPSVVQIRAADVRPEAISLQVIEALRQLAGELDEGALLTIDPRRTRVRVLPLRLP
jgi:predicted nuclease of predicted toxin-antitoxin system